MSTGMKGICVRITMIISANYGTSHLKKSLKKKIDKLMILMFSTSKFREYFRYIPGR